MPHRQLGRLRYVVYIVGIGLFTLVGSPHDGFGMGGIEKKIKERDQRYWDNLEKAKPLIKQRADVLLRKLSYDPAKFTAVVSPKGGGGDEILTVKYWQTPPADYLETVVKPGDLEVYLNSRGVVKRVTQYEGETERLLYGKDERLTTGMTPEQVIERLGNPDYKGRPPRELRDMFDEMWRYKATADRAARIEVYFKNGKVSSDATSFE